MFDTNPGESFFLSQLKLSTMLKKKYLFVLVIALLSSLLFSTVATAQNTRSTEKEAVSFRTPLDVFSFLSSKDFRSSDGVSLEIRPEGVKANSRQITAAVKVTYIRAQQAILKATSPFTGHEYTFIAYADKNCIVCTDDNSMYFGKKKEY